MTGHPAADPQGEHTDQPGTAGPASGAPEDRPVLASVSALEPKHLVRLPHPDAPGLEGLAGQANQRRLADATQRVGAVVPGLIDHLFGQGSAAGTGPLVIPADLAVTADELWSAVDTVLVHDDARAGRLTLGLDATDGVDDQLRFDTTYELHRPNIGQLAQKLADRASINLRAVGQHVDVLHRLCADLETILGQPVEADAIVFGPGSVHVDPSDRGGEVLVIPLDLTLAARLEDAPVADPDATVIPRVSEPASRGRATSVGSNPEGSGSAATHAVSGDADGESGSPEATGSTRTPDRAVVPGHAVVAATEDRLHLASDTVGVAVRLKLPLLSPAQIRTQAAAAARYHPLLRADLPTDLDAPIESYGGSLYATLGAFHTEAALALGEIPQAHAVAMLRAMIPARPRNGLLDVRRAQRDGLPLLSAPLPGGVLVTTVGDEEALVAGGLVCTLAPDLANALTPHLDGRPFDPGPVLATLRSLATSIDLTDVSDLTDPAGPTSSSAIEAEPKPATNSTKVVAPTDPAGERTKQIDNPTGAVGTAADAPPEVDPVQAALDLLLAAELLEVAP
ncbi:MAG: hypothetical protein ABIP03_07925 [Aquihabitans sp.]